MSEPSHQPNRKAALGAARDRANGLLLQAFGALVCAPISVWVLFAVARERRSLRALGLPAHSSLNVAVFIALVPLASMLAVASLTGWITWRTTHRAPQVVIANGSDSVLEIHCDGEWQATLSSGGRHELESMEPGTVELCASRAGHGDEVGCATRELAFGDRLLWNPASSGRFVEVTTHYAQGDDAAPDDVRVLERSEWLDLRGYDHVLEDPPAELRASDRRLERVWLGWGYSEPVLVVVDNATADVMELTADGVARRTIEPGTARELWLREGTHTLVVTRDGSVAFEHAGALRDFGAYLIDPAGERAYVQCTEERLPDEGSRLLTDAIEPRRFHDLSDTDEVLVSETAMSAWRGGTTITRWVTWADEGCDDAGEL